MIYKYLCRILDKSLFQYPISDQRHRTKPDIGISDIRLTERAKSDIISDIGIKFYPISNIWHPLLLKRGVIAEWCSAWLRFRGREFESYWYLRNFWKCQTPEWTLMSILEHPPMKITIFRCKYMHTAEEKKSSQIHETYIFHSKIIDTFCDILSTFQERKVIPSEMSRQTVTFGPQSGPKIRWTHCHTPGP